MTLELDIKSRLRTLLSQEFDARVASAEERLPRRCVHNHRQPLDSRKQTEGVRNETYNRTSLGLDGVRALPVMQTIGLCMLGASDPEAWQGTICEEPIDAKRCPVFESLETKEDILRRFLAEVNDADWLATHRPDIAALVSVLRLSEMPPLPWWKRLLFRLRRIRLEDTAPPFDAARLLPTDSGN